MNKNWIVGYFVLLFLGCGGSRELPPIYCAIEKGDLEELKDLLDQKPFLLNKEFAQWTPLTFAVYENAGKEIFQVLLDSGT